MGSLSAQKPSDTFDSLLHVEDDTAGLVATSTDSRVIQDGVGANSALALATDSVRITSTNKLYFNDVGDEHISSDGTDLTIAAGTALNITADVIDLSDATKDITLNAAVDAINFDSNTLSIDASNNRIGLGTASPTATLDVRGKMYMETSDPGIELLDTGTAPYNPLIFKALRSGGSAVQNGEDLGIIYAQGYDGGAYRDFAQIRFAADAVVSSGDAPGRIELWTTPDSSTTIAERLSVDSNGDVTVATGNIIMGTSGKGINFAATGDSSGSMTNELFDDYEEGTFTVGRSGVTTDAVATDTGYYTKIGNIVYWHWYSGAMTLSSTTGGATLTGLPFTTSSSTNRYGQFTTLHGTAIDGSSPGGYTNLNNTNAQFVDLNNTTSASWINSGGNLYIMVQGFYHV